MYLVKNRSVTDILPMLTEMYTRKQVNPKNGLEIITINENEVDEFILDSNTVEADRHEVYDDSETTEEQEVNASDVDVVESESESLESVQSLDDDILCSVLVSKWFFVCVCFVFLLTLVSFSISLITTVWGAKMLQKVKNNTKEAT